MVEGNAPSAAFVFSLGLSPPPIASVIELATLVADTPSFPLDISTLYPTRPAEYTPRLSALYRSLYELDQ